MVAGDRIYLPITVQELPIENKKESPCSVVEVNFIRSLVLYKVLGFIYFYFILMDTSLIYMF